jgi:hypothetical protein
MNKISFVLSLIVLSTLMGCAGNHEAISRITIDSRQDVFQVTSKSQAVPGKALLNIEFPVKANKAYVFGSAIKHDNPPYNVVINIDGQAVELADEPILENIPGHHDDNPEAGKGWKYQFRKSLLIIPGTHRISIAVPLADVVVEKEVILREGGNLLQLVPTYKTSITRYPRSPWFTKGLRSISIMLNGEVLAL